MKYQVKLRYHEDEDNGIWGFCHENTVGFFNPFYEPSGIFHDVFEHYFEGTGCFKGEGFCNVFGEMVATAHKYYITNQIGINPFMYRYGSPIDYTFRVDTEYMIKEYFRKDDYLDYNVEGMKIPYQKPEPHIEYVIRDYINEIKNKSDSESLSYVCKQLRNAYRLGYKMARKMYRNEGKVYSMFYEFLTFWNTFMKTNEASSLHIEDSEYGLKSILFNVDTVRCTCNTKLIDDVGNVYPISNLTSY